MWVRDYVTFHVATHVITLHHVIDLFSKNKTVQCVFYSYHIHLPWDVRVKFWQIKISVSKAKLYYYKHLQSKFGGAFGKLVLTCQIHRKVFLHQTFTYLIRMDNHNCTNLWDMGYSYAQQPIARVSTHMCTFTQPNYKYVR